MLNCIHNICQSKKLKKTILLILLLFAFSFHQLYAQPIDEHATVETKSLYAFLQLSLQKGILFGHQDDLAYGYNWQYKKGKSDIKSVIGSYPAVYGFEISGIELDAEHDIDGVPFVKTQKLIQQAYERGGIITISWHLHNPLTGKTAWDAAPGTVASVLPGGKNNSLYNSWLDKVARFFNTLKGKSGEYIPIIFRPFHELNGNWFWWGRVHCSPDEMKQLYQYTVHYLMDVANVHHLLYAYNTDKFHGLEEYAERYPGNTIVDIVGFDIYQQNNKDDEFIKNCRTMLAALDTFALENHKIPALTEFGYNTIPNEHWWTNTFLPAVKDARIAYALAWRNAGVKHDGSKEYYVPFKGEASAPDFLQMTKSGMFLFQNQLTFSKVYQLFSHK